MLQSSPKRTTDVSATVIGGEDAVGQHEQRTQPGRVSAKHDAAAYGAGVLPGNGTDASATTDLTRLELRAHG